MSGLVIPWLGYLLMGLAVLLLLIPGRPFIKKIFKQSQQPINRIDDYKNGQMKLKVRMNDKGRVEAIERDDKTPNWITKYQQANQQKLPPLPKWLYPVLNIRDEKGYRTLTNDTGSYFISKALEVTPFSGQWWNSLRDDRKAEVLELVEWLGGDANEYVNSSEIMYPKDPDFSKRK